MIHGERAFKTHLRDQQRLTRELVGILKDAANTAEIMVRNLPEDAVLQRMQMQQVLMELRTHQTAMWDQVNGAITSNIDRTMETVRGDVDSMMRLMTKSAHPDAAVRVIQAGQNTVENVVSRLRNAIDLSPRVYRNGQAGIAKVESVVNRNIALGRSARDIARDVRYLINPNTPGGVSYAALRLGRTELNNAFHRSTVETWRRMPFVAEVRWNLSGSHPRPDPCDSLASDGPYQRNQVPAKPHPQCLCYVTAVVPDSDDFLDEMMRGDYDQWLVSQGQTPLR